VSYPVTVALVSGKTQSVSLSVSDVPSGTKAEFSTSSDIAVVATTASTKLYVNGQFVEELDPVRLGTNEEANTAIGGTGEGVGGDNGYLTFCARALIGNHHRVFRTSLVPRSYGHQLNKANYVIAVNKFVLRTSAGVHGQPRIEFRVFLTETAQCVKVEP
jgi:hypothetical protein